MKDKYEQKVKKYGPVPVPWLNLFDFEIFGEYEPRAEQQLNFQLPKAKLFEPKLRVLNPVIQQFALPQPMINVMLQKSDAETIFKLHQTCKFFFLKYPHPICYKFVGNRYWRGPDRTPHKTAKSSFNLNLDIFEPSIDKQSCHISTALFFSLHVLDKNELPMVIKSMIYKCDARYIKIAKQNLTEDEFKFLAGHGNVLELDLYIVKITKQNGTEMFIDDILKMMPMCYNFGYSFLPHEFVA